MKTLAALLALPLALAPQLDAKEPPSGRVHVGWASTSITPDEPIALAGQFHKRISQRIESPCMATVLALETRRDGQSLEQAIMVS